MPASALASLSSVKAFAVMAIIRYCGCVCSAEGAYGARGVYAVHYVGIITSINIISNSPTDDDANISTPSRPVPCLYYVCAVIPEYELYYFHIKVIILYNKDLCTVHHFQIIRLIESRLIRLFFCVYNKRYDYTKLSPLAPSDSYSLYCRPSAQPVPLL